MKIYSKHYGWVIEGEVKTLDRMTGLQHLHDVSCQSCKSCLLIYLKLVLIRWSCGATGTDAADFYTVKTTCEEARR